jgi:hypothetical protein
MNNEILNYIHASDPKSNEFLNLDLLVKLSNMYQPYTTNYFIEVLKNQCLIGKSLFLDNLTLSVRRVHNFLRRINFFFFFSLWHLILSKSFGRHQNISPFFTVLKYFPPFLYSQSSRSSTTSIFIFVTLFVIFLMVN